MGIKLSSYINESNQKISNEKIRKHLIKILYPEIYGAIYKKTDEKSIKKMAYQNKLEKNIHLNRDKDFAIIKNMSNIEYESPSSDNQVFNHFSYLGVAS